MTRKRLSIEEEILQRVRNHGGFSVFWATENQARAVTIGRLERDRIIERKRPDIYPWCSYKVVEVR